jgi:hypothetical protein
MYEERISKYRTDQDMVLVVLAKIYRGDLEDASGRTRVQKAADEVAKLNAGQSVSPPPKALSAAGPPDWCQKLQRTSTGFKLVSSKKTIFSDGNWIVRVVRVINGRR